jgi:hypothetical protein
MTPAVRPGLARRWWNAANEPLYYDPERSIPRQVLWRTLLWTPVVLPVAAAVLFAAFYTLTVWRAHSLAGQAMESARAGALVKARLQAMSASNLRKNDPTVRRAAVFVASKMNAPDVITMWQQLSRELPLTAEEAKEYAVVAMLFGSPEEFAEADAVLERTGEGTEAASLRAAHELRQGNLGQSIEEARAAAQSGEPQHKLQLARLLVATHGVRLAVSPQPDPADVRGGEEARDLINSLRGTPVASEALGLGLALLPVTMDQAREWAEAALQDLDPSSPALIVAAQFMVESGAARAADLRDKLSPVFARASIGQKAAYAQWLNRHGFADEALLLLTDEEAAEDASAYAGRAMAFAALGQWEGLFSMTEKPTRAPESLRLSSRALAARGLGRTDLIPGLQAQALRAAALDARLSEVLNALDQSGGTEVANDTLLELCADPALAESAFRAARDRFGRQGNLELRSKAWQQASQAAPGAKPVLDYGRRLRLLAGEKVDLRETASALVLPDPAVRFTHALALLREGRADEARQILRDTNKPTAKLPPGDLASLIAVQQAGGEPGAAESLRSLDKTALDPAERALVGL